MVVFQTREDAHFRAKPVLPQAAGVAPAGQSHWRPNRSNDVVTDGGRMRFSKRVAVAAAGIAVALLASACGNSGSGNGGKASKDVTVFTWWADGGEKAGLDGLVSQFK